MPVKKKRTGHTDYRTGGMFYSKFNKGGVSVEYGADAIHGSKVSVTGFDKAAAYAEKVTKAEELVKQKKIDNKKKLRQAANQTSGQEWNNLTHREQVGLKRAIGVPLTNKEYQKKYFPEEPTDKSTLSYLENTRFELSPKE